MRPAVPLKNGILAISASLKAASSLKKHGVSFCHAEAALHDDLAHTMEDPDALGEQRI